MMKKIKLLILLSTAMLFLGKANTYATSGGQQNNALTNSDLQNEGQQIIKIDENLILDNELSELLKNSYVSSSNILNVFDMERREEKFQLIQHFYSKLQKCGFSPKFDLVRCTVVRIKKKDIQNILNKLLDLASLVLKFRKQLVKDNLENSDIELPRINDAYNKAINAFNRAFSRAFLYSSDKTFTDYACRACTACRAEDRFDNYKSFRKIVLEAVPILKEFIKAIEEFKKEDNGIEIKPLDLKNMEKEKKGANLLYNSCEKQNEGQSIIEIDENLNLDSKLRELLSKKYVFSNSSYIFDEEQSEEKFKLITSFCIKLQECGFFPLKSILKYIVVKMKKKDIQSILNKLLNLARNVVEFRKQLAKDGLENLNIKFTKIDVDREKINPMIDSFNAVFSKAFSYNSNKVFTDYVRRVCIARCAKDRFDNYKSFRKIVLDTVPILEEFIKAIEKFKKKDIGKGIKPFDLKNTTKEKKLLI